MLDGVEQLKGTSRTCSRKLIVQEARKVLFSLARKHTNAKCWVCITLGDTAVCNFFRIPPCAADAGFGTIRASQRDSMDPLCRIWAILVYFLPYRQFPRKASVKLPPTLNLSARSGSCPECVCGLAWVRGAEPRDSMKVKTKIRGTR